MRTYRVTRRGVLLGVSAAGGLALVGCGPAEAPDSEPAGAPQANAAGRAPPLPAMTVHRDPSCGCCEAWAQIASKEGFAVTLLDGPDMPAIKKQHGVPDELTSCHTAVVAGYTIEGHVPLDAVKRLLADRPAGLKGIAVPGMPRGSPGMEMPDGSKDPFEVIAFGADGRTSPFRV